MTARRADRARHRNGHGATYAIEFGVRRLLKTACRATGAGSSGAVRGRLPRRPRTRARRRGDPEHAHRLQPEAELLAPVARADVEPAQLAHALQAVVDRVAVGEQPLRGAGDVAVGLQERLERRARARSRTARRRPRAARPSRRRSAAARPGSRSSPTAAAGRRRSARRRARRLRGSPRRRWPRAAPRSAARGSSIGSAVDAAAARRERIAAQPASISRSTVSAARAARRLVAAGDQHEHLGAGHAVALGERRDRATGDGARAALGDRAHAPAPALVASAPAGGRGRPACSRRPRSPAQPPGAPRAAPRGRSARGQHRRAGSPRRPSPRRARARGRARPRRRSSSAAAGASTPSARSWRACAACPTTCRPTRSGALLDALALRRAASAPRPASARRPPASRPTRRSPPGSRRAPCAAARTTSGRPAPDSTASVIASSAARSDTPSAPEVDGRAARRRPRRPPAPRARTATALAAEPLPEARVGGPRRHEDQAGEEARPTMPAPPATR